MLAADRRRKEPRSIPRPGTTAADHQPNTGLTVTDHGGVRAVGLNGLLAHARIAGAVKQSG